MTKKDYILIANAINKEVQKRKNENVAYTIIKKVAVTIGEDLKSENDRFDI